MATHAAGRVDGADLRSAARSGSRDDADADGASGVATTIDVRGRSKDGSDADGADYSLPTAAATAAVITPSDKVVVSDPALAGVDVHTSKSSCGNAGNDAVSDPGNHVRLPAPWIRTAANEKGDAGAIVFTNTDTKQVLHCIEHVRASIALHEAEDAPLNWMKLHTFSRGVIYQNVLTNAIVSTAADALISDSMDSTPDLPSRVKFIPHPDRPLDVRSASCNLWEKVFDEARGMVVYTHTEWCKSEAWTPAHTIDDIVDELAVREAAVDPTAPWLKDYCRETACVVYRNAVTGATARTLANIAVYDLLEYMPDPPAPWLKDIDDQDGDVCVCYVDPRSDTKVESLDAVYELEGLAAAEGRPGWCKVWDAFRGACSYKSETLGVVVTSIEEIIQTEAREEARLAIAAALDMQGSGWERHYCHTAKAVYYDNWIRKDAPAVWTAHEVRCQNALFEAPTAPAPWEKKIDDTFTASLEPDAAPTVVYMHPATLEILTDIHSVKKSEGLNSATDPGDRWHVGWDPDKETVVYKSLSDGVVVSCIDAVEEHDALEATPSPDPSGETAWRKAWDSSQKRVYFCSEATKHFERRSVWTMQEAVAEVALEKETSRIETALNLAEDPGTGWIKQWCTSANAVVYRHRIETSFVANNTADVRIKDALDTIDTPMQGAWTKYWCTSARKVRFRNTVSNMYVIRTGV